MFKRPPPPESGAPALHFTFDGEPMLAREGDTVAAALLTGGVLACRTTAVSGSPRGPYCLMGVCFECLVTIDGRANQQACMIALRDGMCVEAQRGARALRDAPGDAQA